MIDLQLTMSALIVNLLLVLWLAVALAALAYNGWLVAHGVDAVQGTLAFPPSKRCSTGMPTERGAGRYSESDCRE